MGKHTEQLQKLQVRAARTRATRRMMVAIEFLRFVIQVLEQITERLADIATTMAIANGIDEQMEERDADTEDGGCGGG